MNQPPIYKASWYDGLMGLFYRIASDGWLPPSWFSRLPPKSTELKPVKGMMSLEIVSHCWNYSNTLAYQLSSLVNHPPKALKLKHTVFYCPEDGKTEQLLDYFKTIEVDNVEWNPQPLPKEHLLRRSIGRNRAALNTDADWIWFTDCDIIFGKDCLDSLAKACQGLQERLIFPLHEYTTPMLADDDPMLQEQAKPQVVSIDESNFTFQTRDKAKGAFQIVHGDVARAVGYCADISIYHKPQEFWRKTYEDKVFRWILQGRGVPVDIPAVFQIRHIHKGRYKKDSFWSKVRSKVRRLQE